MIKIKSKNVDATKLNQLQEEYQKIVAEQHEIRWPSDQKSKEYKEAHKKYEEISDQLRVKRLEYIKLFFEKFNGRYLRMSFPGSKSDFIYLKDATVEPCDKDKSHSCKIKEGVFYFFNPGKSKFVTKSGVGCYYNANNGLPKFHAFRLDKYDKVTVTEITKEEFNELTAKETLNTDKLPDKVRHMLITWMMRMPFEALQKSDEYKKVRLETLLAQNRVSLAKERESNFCLKNNLAEAIKEAGKKYAKVLTKGYELEIAKSDKKIAQLEKRIEKKEIELGLKKTPKKKK